MADKGFTMEAARDMIETGRKLEDLGHRVIEELMKAPERDIRDRVLYELRDAALSSPTRSWIGTRSPAGPSGGLERCI